MVRDQSGRREGMSMGGAMAQRRALKRLRLRSPLQLMNEERDLVVRAWRALVAHDQRAEEATVHVRLDVAHVVMEWPCADRVLRRVDTYVQLRCVATEQVGTPRSVGIVWVDALLMG